MSDFVFVTMCCNINEIKCCINKSLQFGPQRYFSLSKKYTYMNESKDSCTSNWFSVFDRYDWPPEFAFVYKTSAIKVHPYVVPHFYFYNSLTWVWGTSCGVQQHKEKQIQQRQGSVCHKRLTTTPLHALFLWSAAFGCHFSLALSIKANWACM